MTKVPIGEIWKFEDETPRFSFSVLVVSIASNHGDYTCYHALNLTTKNLIIVTLGGSIYGYWRKIA